MQLVTCRRSGCSIHSHY